MREWRNLRDVLIVGFSLTMGAYEIVVGGGRAVVLGFLGSLLLSPIAIRVDEARKERRENGGGQ